MIIYIFRKMKTVKVSYFPLRNHYNINKVNKEEKKWQEKR